MRPPCDHILRTIATVLAKDYMPMLETDHARAEMGLMTLIIGAVSEEFERVAHRRIEENREMRKIFKKAVSIVKDDDLKKRLAEASEKIEVDFHTSALDQLNADLAKVFIDLSAHVEKLEGPEAGDLEETIWKEIENRVHRREFLTWEMAAAMMSAARKEADGE